ncbi:MAG: helix-turn-helix domain-containing protein [Hyphomonas sp.]|nr:TetR/AcrR family transcriptional regulator [Hyphomonas sp.]MCB9961042.1 TetR/AcrR family transcriptional regulator [Hyphomonas sp.]MCB9970333.1 TetR/AcrR family transcriptional regulator [Hyphomonas sp.]
MADVATPSATSPPRLTQAERRDRSERELLEATLRVVSEQGVSAATFEAIGRAAGYSRGLVTQRFGSKDGLIRSLIAYLHTWQDEALDRDHVAEMDGLSALCAFVALHCQGLDRHDEAKAYYMLLAGSVADQSDTREAFAESHELERVLIRTIIERGQVAGDIRKDTDADAMALMTGCSLMGIRMQALIDPETDIAPIRDALIASLRARLAPEQEHRRGK